MINDVATGCTFAGFRINAAVKEEKKKRGKENGEPRLRKERRRGTGSRSVRARASTIASALDSFYSSLIHKSTGRRRRGCPRLFSGCLSRRGDTSRGLCERLILCARRLEALSRTHRHGRPVSIDKKKRCTYLIARDYRIGAGTVSRRADATVTGLRILANRVPAARTLQRGTLVDVWKEGSESARL